ncbi:uncharacterized protein LOC111112657 isoform X2 [Crassostrea virginica]
MAKLSAKEYWLLKEIVEDFRESVPPWRLCSIMRYYLPWRQLAECEWYWSDLSIESMSSLLFDVLTKHPYQMQDLLKACDQLELIHAENLVKKMKMFQNLKMKTSTIFPKEAQDTRKIPLPSTDFEKTDAKLACLGQLMMTVCADLFKDVLHYYIQPAELGSELRKICDYITSIMNNEQSTVIKKSTLLFSTMRCEGDVTRLFTKDLSLLYILIRFMCNIPPPQTGWGCCPENDDKSLAGCIERIRILGKTILDHSRKIKEILESDFQDISKNIRTNISEIQKIVFKKDSYTQAVDELLSLDIKLSGRYIHDFRNLESKEDTISPFAVIQYYPDRETENLFRVCTLIDTISSNLFRDTLCRFVNPASLEFSKHIDENLPNSHPRPKDIELLFCYDYLRKNCGISPHKCGWGFLPDTNDHSLAACIDRIIVQRNAIAASMKCGISDSNFHEIWRKLRDDIIEIEKQVIGGNAYVQRVHDLFSMPINQVLAVKYVAEIVHTMSIWDLSRADISKGMPEKSSLSMKPDDGETGMPEMSSWSLKSDDGETGIPEKLSLSMKPDDGETEEDCRSLPALSTEQTELFESIDKTIEQKFSKDSLAGDIFEEQGLTLVGREIKSLSKEVPVLHNPAIYQRTRGFKPGAVLILEVEVSKQNGEVKCTEKNTIFAGNISKSKRDYNPRVLLVKSKPELKEDAKSVVFREYREFISMGNTFVQYETDDNLELSKLSAFYSVSFVCDQIQPMIKFNQVNTGIQPMIKFYQVNIGKAYQIQPMNKFNQVNIGEAIETFFSKTNISFVFFDVILKDGDIEVGSVAHESYFCNNETSVNLIRQNLELEAIRKICTAFGLDFHLRNNASSGSNNFTETSLPFNIYGRILFQAVLANLQNDADRLHAKVTMPVDVNSRDWRQEVAEALFSSIKSNIYKTEKRFKKICIETHKDLRRVCTELQQYKNRCYQNSIKEYIIGCVNEEREQLLEKFPSVLTYIVGKKHGKSTIKVFLKYDDSKAEGYFRQDFHEHVTQFVNVSKRIEENVEEPSPYKPKQLKIEDRKRLKEVIKRHSTALTTNHSQIFQISTGTMPDDKEEPCIVIHCFDKSLVPIGEQELPNELEDCPIYIKEGVIMFGSCKGCTSLKKGCSIGVPSDEDVGSIGSFVTIRNRVTLQKKTGFITAAHVALPTFKEFYREKKLFSEHVIKDPYKIVHAMLDDKTPKEIGVVSEAFCGTYKVSEAFCGTYRKTYKGIDAAFVETNGENEAHNGLQLADEDNLKFGGITLVTKTGSETSTTKGRLHDVEDHICFNHCGVKCHFHDVYSVCNLPEVNPHFFLPGDSGSAVYLIDENGDSDKALGIGFAIMLDKKDHKVYTYVGSIKTIVDALNVDVIAE